MQQTRNTSHKEEVMSQQEDGLDVNTSTAQGTGTQMI